MAKGDRRALEKKTTEGGPLAVWKAQYAALGRLIESYEEHLRLAALGGTNLDPSGLTGGFTPTSVELPTGAFLGLSIPEAIKLYLSAVKQKRTAREIANALKEGGMESTAANWETTVTGALHRLKAAGAVLRFKDGWGLAELYPETLRSRLAKEDKPRKSPRRKKATKATVRAIRLREESSTEKAAS
jgi:hypothetical protein